MSFCVICYFWQIVVCHEKPEQQPALSEYCTLNKKEPVKSLLTPCPRSCEVYTWGLNCTINSPLNEWNKYRLQIDTRLWELSSLVLVFRTLSAKAALVVQGGHRRGRPWVSHIRVQKPSMELHGSALPLSTAVSSRTHRVVTGSQRCSASHSPLSFWWNCCSNHSRLTQLEYRDRDLRGWMFDLRRPHQLARSCCVNQRIIPVFESHRERLRWSDECT